MQGLKYNIGFCLLVCTLALMPISSILSAAHSTELELIFVDEGETYSDNLGIRVYSPGDLDFDGYSEVFASNALGEIKVYKGGNPADTIPDKVYLGQPGVYTWLSDINGDGLDDFALGRGESEAEYINIYFGGLGFYDKSEADLTIVGSYAEGFGMGIFSANTNNDNKNDLIISAPNTSSPIAGRFYIYQGYPLLDSIADDTINVARTTRDEFYTGACIGDINGDGYADYATTPYSSIIPSYVLIFMGSENSDSIPDIQILSPFEDAPGIGVFAKTIVSTGDINKDNFDDFIVTSEGFPPCIFYGGSSFDPTPKILDSIGSVANVCGDINHDGWQDIAVGNLLYSFGSGEVLVYFGAHDMDTIADIIMPYWSVTPQSYNFGRSVGPAGDFNGDGVDDLAVGAKSYNIPNSGGYVYVFAGDPNLPTAAEDEPEVPIPAQYDLLYQNYPNPFNNKTIIEYYIHGISEREVELSIFNILGQKIRTLYSRPQSGGDHVIFWDGLDDLGHDVPSGIYFYQLRTGQDIISKKMVYFK